MLATIATANTTLGDSLLNPSDLPRAVAHTASKTPDMTRTSQDTRNSLGRLVAHRVRHPSSGSHRRGSTPTMSHLESAGKESTAAPRQYDYAPILWISMSSRMIGT